MSFSSFEEHGRYDIPAMVSFVQEKTGGERMFYVGHSMGMNMNEWLVWAHCDKIICQTNAKLIGLLLTYYEDTPLR